MGNNTFTKVRSTGTSYGKQKNPKQNKRPNPGHLVSIQSSGRVTTRELAERAAQMSAQFIGSFPEFVFNAEYRTAIGFALGVSLEALFLFQF
jgi:hypothetical protein